MGFRIILNSSVRTSNQRNEYFVCSPKLSFPKIKSKKNLYSSNQQSSKHCPTLLFPRNTFNVFNALLTNFALLCYCFMLLLLMLKNTGRGSQGKTQHRLKISHQLIYIGRNPFFLPSISCFESSADSLFSEKHSVCPGIGTKNR